MTSYLVVLTVYSGSCSTTRERRSGLYALTTVLFSSIWSSCSAVAESVSHFLTSWVFGAGLGYSRVRASVGVRVRVIVGL